MKTDISHIENAIENLAVQVCMLDEEDVPALGQILNAVSSLEQDLQGCQCIQFFDMIRALENYLGRLILNETRDLKPLETGVATLQAIWRYIGKGIEASFENIDCRRLVEKITTAETHQGEIEPLGRILVDSGSISQEDLRNGLKIQKKNPEKKLGKILLEEKKTEPDRIQAALKSQAKGKHTANLQVKVDTAKLDNLVDLTGELVISQSMFKKIGLDMAATDQKYFQYLNQVTQAVTAIQKIAMSMRMIPIKNTFQKMFRIVRDLTRNSGKVVDIVLSGEETEIDRNIVDELYEPMVHIIRNSVDHGLETADERKAVGKQPTGAIHLSAGQKGGNIVIEIKDDGRGLDRNRIFDKAVSCSLATKNDLLTDKEIYQFIMQPGFSTAREVTEISGRGVGMDVVKEGIEKLRGRLEIDSAPGKGTTLTISLPLTLAIMDGMLVKVGEERYILPTHAIIDSFRPEKENCYTVEQKGEMVRHRGNLVPVVRLNQLFNVQGGVSIPWEGILVIVENNGEKKAILLDELVGKDDFVIKSIGSALKNVQGVAGGSILSDGQVGLIIDMPGLFQMTGIAGS